MNIYQKLHQIQCDIISLKKDKKAMTYEYVTGDKVLDFIKPKMNSLGLLLKQEILSIDNVRQDYATKSNPNKSEINSKVMMRFTWVDVETGEKDENLFGANGQNDWDKGVGSALTYAERYFLLKYFHISTDEDDVDKLKREETVAPPKPFFTEERFEKAKQAGATVEKVKEIYQITSEIESAYKSYLAE